MLHLPRPRGDRLQLPPAAASLSLRRLTYTAGDAQRGVVSDCELPRPGPSKIAVDSDAVLVDTVPPLTLAVYAELAA